MTSNEAERERLAREGMYRPEFEGDACGVGLVAATDGKVSRRVVQSAIEASRRARTGALFSASSLSVHRPVVSWIIGESACIFAAALLVPNAAIGP